MAHANYSNEARQRVGDAVIMHQILSFRVNVEAKEAIIVLLLCQRERESEEVSEQN